MRSPLLTACIFLCVASSAQLPFKFTNDISPVLSKVINDYPNGFSNIKGAIVDEGPQVTDFLCLLSMSGAAAPGIITQFGEEKEHVYSWKNTMLETENFAEARQKFKQYFSQIKKTTAILNNIEIKLAADYEDPDENKSFNDILFAVETVEPHVKDVTVDLNMAYETGMWKITISVYHLQDTHNGLAIQ